MRGEGRASCDGGERRGDERESTKWGEARVLFSPPGFLAPPAARAGAHHGVTEGGVGCVRAWCVDVRDAASARGGCAGGGARTALVARRSREWGGRPVCFTPLFFFRASTRAPARRPGRPGTTARSTHARAPFSTSLRAPRVSEVGRQTASGLVTCLSHLLFYLPVDFCAPPPWRRRCVHTPGERECGGPPTRARTIPIGRGRRVCARAAT